MSFARSCSKPGHRHNDSQHVKTSERCSQLQSTNHRLIFGGIFTSEFFALIDLGMIVAFKWRVIQFGKFTEYLLIGCKHLLDISAWSTCECTIAITGVVASEVIGQRSHPMSLKPCTFSKVSVIFLGSLEAKRRSSVYTIIYS